MDTKAKEQTQEITQQANEVAEKLNQEVEKTQKDLNEKAEDSLKEQTNNQESVNNEAKEKMVEIEETIEEKTKPKSKVDDIKQKVQELQHEVKGCYEDYNQSLRDFKEASSSLAEQENKVVKTTVEHTISLLDRLKVPNLQDLKASTRDIELENEEELLEVKEPSKGKFKGFFFGALASIATFAGLELYGAKMANLSLNLQTFLQKANLDSIANKYLELLNFKAPTSAGYALEIATSLIVGFLIYKLVVISKKIKNTKYINNKIQESQEYKDRLNKSKSELVNLIDHIGKIKSVTSKYDIILQEQNAKINRMLFIEEPEDMHSLHSKSKAEVEKTILILDEFVKLMDTPVSKKDTINPESIKNLKSANLVINEVIKSLY